ncbi:MAG: FlgD immunoglobulin-like domain containing protein, partial [Candidatus Poseidoniales archaeon]
ATSLLFKSLDTLSQIIQFSIADYRGLDSLLTLKIPSTDLNNFSCRLQYKFLDSNNVLIESAIYDLNLEILPDKFVVMDNYPNPFNPKTTIQYELPKEQEVSIYIYDSIGRTIYSTELNKTQPGRHQFSWNGLNQLGNKVSTGIYFFQLKAGENMRTQKMLLLK